MQNQATGKYLNSARVAIKGTPHLTLTDETGNYRLNNVPPGPVVLEVFYTGLDGQEISLQVAAGQSLQQDVSLTSVARYGDTSGIVKLDSFVVASSREVDASAIAINEQRFAPNIKNVVATDAFGDLAGGNVGEFLKFLPGVLAADPGSAGAAEVGEISLRGLKSSLTVFSSDGAQLANAHSEGNSRTFQLNQVSINNIARIEVTKVPTPANPADSMAGAVNMVSRSAFEKNGSEFQYRVSLSSNTRYFDFSKTPDALDPTKRTFKTYPGFDFAYTLPLTKNFGIVVAGLHTTLLYPTDAIRRNFATSGTGTNASFSKPYFQSFQIIDTLNRSDRNSVSLKADWRVAPNSVLSFGIQSNYYSNDIASYTITQSVGNNATPTVAGGTVFSYGDDFTTGATGRGSMNLGGTFRKTQATTSAANVLYRYNDGNWKVEGGVSKSYSRHWWRDTSEDFFSSVTIAGRNPVRVAFSGISVEGGPAKIQVFDNTNREVDVLNGSNYIITGAASAPREVRDELGVLSLSVRRNLAFLAFPASIQIGGLQQEQERDSRRRAKTWTYSPPNGDPSITPYLTTSTPYGDQRVSNVLAWRAFQNNPGLFVQTPAQIVANARDYITNSVYLKEKISAAYMQGEMRLLNNRLNILSGVRFEKTVDSGRGPLEQLSAVFARNPDGTFVHNAAGARVRRPEAGAAGSIEELRLIYKERAYGARRTYDGFFPSLHLNFNVTENFIARAAYAKTYGRPNFAEIIPTLQEREDDPAGITNPGVALGRVTTSNTGLKPWSADNYDLSLEYYTRQGGLFSLGLFRKEIDNFFGNFAKIATLEELNALGLDARYVGWEVLSKVNAGSARISGFEFNFKHDLDRLGAWGKHFTVFVNGTKLKLQGNREADFLGYIPDSANWGVTFRRNPITFVARWNYRGKYQAGTFVTMGPDAYHYNWSKKPTLDLNLDYSVHQKISFFANAKNVFNEKSLGSRYGSETPEYAKLFQPASVGVVISVGIKGTF